MSTPAKYEFSYAWLITQRQYFTFSLEACRSAHIALAEVPGNASSKSYEVVLGALDNVRTIIIGERSTPWDNVTVSKETPFVLDCFYPRDFWITWDNQTIKVGRGLTFNDKIIEWKVPTSMLHPVNAVGISTDTRSVGLWEIQHDAGDD